MSGFASRSPPTSPTTRWCAKSYRSSGSSNENPAANFFRVTRDPKPTMEKTTQVFLGVRMVCAQCHDHPFERWTQNQYYEMSAFFSALGIRPGYEVGEEIVYNQREDFDMKHPKDGRVMKPKFIVPASYGSTGPVPTDSRRRMALAEWVTAEGQSVLREIHRQPGVELFLRPRHYRPGGRHSRFESAQQSRAAGCAHQGLHRPQLRSAAAHADHRQFAHLSGRVMATNEWNDKDSDNFSHAVPRRLARRN